MSPREFFDSCVKWCNLVPVLLGLSVAILTASAWIVQVHAEGTHKEHVTRHEYNQFTALLLDRLDRIENKLDRIEPATR